MNKEDNKILAIIINGRHAGKAIPCNYYPSIRLPIEREPQIGTKESFIDSLINDSVEYKECFRSVDRKIVLYSTTGESDDISEIKKKWEEELKKELEEKKFKKVKKKKFATSTSEATDYCIGFNRAIDEILELLDNL